MPYNMVVLWPNMKQEVSLCPWWHSKAKLVSETCKSDHKSDEAHKKDESRETMELENDA